MNAALQQQCSSVLSTLYETVNVVLKKWSNASLNFIYVMQSYIIKFCPTKKSIFSGGPRRKFKTLRLKHYRKSETAIQKCSPKILFWETSQNLHFSGIISQNSQELKCGEVLFEWYFEPSVLYLLYKGLHSWCFSVNLWNY